MKIDSDAQDDKVIIPNISKPSKDNDDIDVDDLKLLSKKSKIPLQFQPIIRFPLHKVEVQPNTDQSSTPVAPDSSTLAPPPAAPASAPPLQQSKGNLETREPQKYYMIHMEIYDMLEKVHRYHFYLNAATFFKKDLDQLNSH